MTAEPTLEELFKVRDDLWRSRDACLDHFPLPCPEGCPGKGESPCHICGYPGAAYGSCNHDGTAWEGRP